jgi:hypothetical protein
MRAMDYENKAGRKAMARRKLHRGGKRAVTVKGSGVENQKRKVVRSLEGDRGQ